MPQPAGPREIGALSDPGLQGEASKQSYIIGVLFKGIVGFYDFYNRVPFKGAIGFYRASPSLGFLYWGQAWDLRRE